MAAQDELAGEDASRAAEPARPDVRLLAGYRAILARRGARGFCSTAFAGRLPVAMTGVAVVFLVHGTTGSYALAGAMNAIAIISAAAAGPAFGRMVDRLGQRPVLVPQITLHVMALAAEVAAAAMHAPTPVLLLTAVPAGAFTPAIGALVRVRWSWLLGQAPDLDRAYALESVLDDLVFTVGPVIAAALCVWRIEAGLLAAAAIELCAGMAFALNRAAAPPPAAPARKHLLATLSAPGLPMLLAAVFFVGILLGTLNIAVVAFAQDHGASSASGWLLGGFAASSMIAGIAFGQVRWRQPPEHRLRIVLPYLAVAAVALPFAPTPALLGAALVAAGSGLSPTLISAYTTADRLAPADSIAETLTWVVTALTGGSAAGAALSGLVANHGDARPGFLVGSAAAALAAAASLSGRRSLPRSSFRRHGKI
jgi:MFS family permease